MQSKKQSAIESVANTAIGFTINCTANLLILPLFGFDVTAAQTLGLGAIFTIISIVRGYFVRRAFNAIHKKTNGIR